MVVNSNSADLVPALSRGLDIIECLASCKNDVGFNELAERLKLPTTTLTRLLKLLMERGYAVKDEQTKRYRPGPRLSVWNHGLPISDRLRRAADGLLRELADKSSHTVLLIHWNGAQMQCLAKEAHESSVTMQPVGTIADNLAERAWGWIFWSSLDQPHQIAALRRCPKPDAMAKALRKHLKKFTRHGFAYEDAKSIRRLAAPVYDNMHNLVGCVCMGGTKLTLRNAAKVNAMGILLAQSAAKISQRLGGVATLL
jgi:DNA-binding IclR family transcriptional regulator